ncbi:hypothetical protein [Nocardia mexicana]|uniref:Secreted protein n=1 Tax=Nocardia mexicana TaxID=279262 RepID=A0A370GXR0_9NOCA|nr:hypothetical protein [Nocardia mexicana]RDI46663.1 hypothetical protein DFR68_11068 [Nocardia mexicana]
MTAAIWFGLAAIALVGAIVLLYFDRLQRQRTGHVRQVWAKSQGYTYVSVEPSLASNWRRGAMAKLGYLSAVDVVSGNRKGEKFVLFDLEDAATLVAVRRQIGSDIDIDLRLKTAAPPKDADLELLGAIGDRVVFATNPDIARHAVDQRMVAFIESLPDSVQQLWSEGNWTLGMLPVGTTSRDWEGAIDAVLRLSGLLHVLPPVAGGSDSGRRDGDMHDPGRPRPRPRGAEPDEDDYQEQDSRYATSRFDDDAEYDRAYDDDRPYDEGRSYDEDRPDAYDEGGPYGGDRAYGKDGGYDEGGPYGGDRAYAKNSSDDEGAPYGDRAYREDRSYEADRDRGVRDDRRYEYEDEDADFAPLVKDIAGETDPEPPRRPQLAVVPDPRQRIRRDWPPAEELPEDDETDSPAADFDDDFVEDDWREGRTRDELPDQPGGPFHPGFRPYQGPAPR